MAVAFQQQIFALDARYNSYRAPNHPNFRTLYIRRRSQLLRENAKFKDIETIKCYLNVRASLLARKYGADTTSLGSGVSRPRSLTKASLGIEDVKRNEGSICDNYAFSGVHHIFDQHTEQVSVVKFANNDRSLLCCGSHDGCVSICRVTPAPAALLHMLRGHSAPVTGCEWSSSNAVLVSVSLDALACVWDTGSGALLRRVADLQRAPLLAAAFQPANNNMILTGNARGMVSVLNVSTGIHAKGGSSILGGQVLALAFESSGRLFWAANDKGAIVSYRVDVARGSLSKLRRATVGGAVTCLSWSPWLARRPALLANAADNSLYLFRVCEGAEGRLALVRRWHVAHASPAHALRSTFCPVMSMSRAAACVVTAAEDSCVYFLDVHAPPHRTLLNKLQGHAAPVLGVSFSYDESLLASSDTQGLVIVWRRTRLDPGAAPPSR